MTSPLMAIRFVLTPWTEAVPLLTDSASFAVWPEPAEINDGYDWHVAVLLMLPSDFPVFVRVYRFHDQLVAREFVSPPQSFAD